MKRVALLTAGLAACSTVGGLSDSAMPDRFGLGTSTGTGSFDGTIQDVGAGHAGAELWKGDADITGASAWLEWDIPSVGSGGRTSFEGMKDRFVNDYKGEESGLLTVKKVVDEATGEETYSFGVGEAAGGSLATLLTFLGYRTVQRKRNGGGDAS